MWNKWQDAKLRLSFSKIPLKQLIASKQYHIYYGNFFNAQNYTKDLNRQLSAQARSPRTPLYWVPACRYVALDPVYIIRNFLDLYENMSGLSAMFLNESYDITGPLCLYTTTIRNEVDDQETIRSRLFFHFKNFIQLPKFLCNICSNYRLRNYLVQ